MINLKCRYCENDVADPFYDKYCKECEENGTASRKIWEFIEKVTLEVGTWPAWKKEGWDMVELPQR